MKKKSNSLTIRETFLTAIKNYKEKDFKTAEIFCYKILSIDPNNFDSIFLLANIAAIKRNFDQANNLLHQAIKIKPQNVSALNNLGTTYKELGKFENAINYYKKTIEIDSNHVNAHYNLGVIFYNLKDLKKAKSYFQKTVKVQNNYAAAFFNLANVHVDLKEFENALNCYQKSIEINPNFVGAHNNLGLVYRELNDFQNAVSCYENVLKINPKHVGAYHNLALAYKELGEFKRSIKSHEMAIKYDPENTIHYYYLNELKKNILDLNLKNKIKQIIKNRKSTKRTVAYGNYLLSKYEEKTKKYKEELDYLTKGHMVFFESKKKKFDLGIKYCFDYVLEIVEGVNVIKTDKKNDHDIKPIFIVGVPRCGSTLVEKIIGSGQKLIPLGEETSVLEDFVNAKALEKQSLNFGNVEDLRNELSHIYKKKGLLSKQYDFTFTDKSLNNFFYIGLIKEIFPNAKIINCKRNNLSTIMSIFQNNLTELAWAHDLKNIFRYFNNYYEIIENFNKIYPNFVYELQFEKLVDNPEEESKKLMKYCELPWDKKCLEFYKRKDLISKTSSNIQIRKAIYKHSIHKYLPYKKFLDKYGEKYAWYN